MDPWIANGRRRWRSIPSAVVLGAALGSGAALGACTATAFACDGDHDCRDGERSGICEVRGYCSFTDDTCATGRAYGRHAPPGIAGECVQPQPTIATTDDDSGSAEAGDDTTGPAPRRHDESSTGSDESTAAGEDSSTGEPVHGCANGLRDGAETDVDCGGSCDACGHCESCELDADCSVGACDDGRCRVHATLTTDWIYDCAHAGELTAQLDLPAGAYRATALPGAGSKWNDDAAVGGKTWAFWLDCDGGLSFGDMRTPLNQWYETPDDAFAAVVADTAVVQHAGGPIACGVYDSECADNRGGVAVELASACE